VETVAVLFARSDSVYKALPGADVWDLERDALQWPGGSSVVAHPPCGPWGNQRNCYRPSDAERALAPWAVEQVRQWGGVLEHPASSALWPALALPAPGTGRDEFGGWTFTILQSSWGHRADKPTRLYIVGCDPLDLPDMPLKLGRATNIVSPRGGFRKGMPGWRPSLNKPEREATPRALAEWLLELARRCRLPVLST